MADEKYSIPTRLIGAEDIFFYVAGESSETTYTDINGVSHVITKLNATHIPITEDASAQVEQAANVQSAITVLSRKINEVAAQKAAALSEDKTVSLSDYSGRQALIDAEFKNLGGKTLTFLFPQNEVSVTTNPLKFYGFYNGTLIIDLNGTTVQDSGALNPAEVLLVENCNCSVKIINGTINHLYNTYGVGLVRTANCSFESVTFHCGNVSTDYAVLAYMSNGYFDSCSFDAGAKQVLVQSIYEDALEAHNADTSAHGIASSISTHNTSASAHSTLFAGKANASHTHTASDLSGVELAGSVSSHNSDASAHSTLFAGKANSSHTHSKSDISDASTTIPNMTFSNLGVSNVLSAIRDLGFQYCGKSYPTNLPATPVMTDGGGWFILPLPVNTSGDFIPIVVEWGEVTMTGSEGETEVEVTIPVPIRQYFHVSLTTCNTLNSAQYHLDSFAQFVGFTSSTKFKCFRQNIETISDPVKIQWFVIGIYGGSFSSLPPNYTPSA